MFLLVGMLGFLLLPNTVAAEYVDEYVAKHPRRVKITISQNAKGQYSGEALFSRVHIIPQRLSNSSRLITISGRPLGILAHHLSPVKIPTKKDPHQ
jgi:hypothetical protein